ncbi:MAG: hypothetical protein RLZZ401_2341 [Pseudomonadota bacterium]|jgi:hypothetical protein
MLWSRFTRFFLLLLALWLTGCASTRLIDSDVRSTSSFRSAPVVGYRFERLPSQQSPDLLAQQSSVEAMAEQAMAKVGLRRDDAQAGYSVMVGHRIERRWRYGAAPWLGSGFMGVGFGGGRGRGGFGGGFSFGGGYRGADFPIYLREVSLLVRDLSSGQVVYETAASNESPWADDGNVLPVLFEAAISGFPTPPAGVRRVNIDLLPPPAKK